MSGFEAFNAGAIEGQMSAIAGTRQMREIEAGQDEFVRLRPDVRTSDRWWLAAAAFVVLVAGIGTFNPVLFWGGAAVLTFEMVRYRVRVHKRMRALAADISA